MDGFLFMHQLGPGNGVFLEAPVRAEAYRVESLHFCCAALLKELSHQLASCGFRDFVLVLFRFQQRIEQVTADQLVVQVPVGGRA